MSEHTKPNKETKTADDCNVDEVFLASILLPNAADAFLSRTTSLDEAIKDADIVLDTNALLLPYGAGAGSLKQITSTLKKLKAESRLYLPAQAAREFIKNRPSKVSELHQGLADRISRYVALDEVSYPIFEEVEGYKELNELLKKTKALKKELTEANTNLLRTIRAWEWNDPVNASYKDVFTQELVVEPNVDKEETLKDLLKRNRLSIPPGYKDSGKTDLGIGDLLIWKTILAIGEKNKRNLIFVSGDEKADWQHRTGGSGFLPRFELLDEYRRASGKVFYIVPLSKLLELLSVDTSFVEEIKQEEVRIQEANTVAIACPYCESTLQWRLEDHPGASAKPRCQSCGEAFHIHRTRDGVTIHKVNERSSKRVEGQLELVPCPACQYVMEATLGTAFNSTAWCRCDMCETNFPIHRTAEGGLKLGRIGNFG